MKLGRRRKSHKGLVSIVIVEPIVEPMEHYTTALAIILAVWTQQELLCWAGQQRPDSFIGFIQNFQY